MPHQPIDVAIYVSDPRILEVEGQEFNVILSHTMSSWPSWATGIPRKKKRGVERKDKGIEKKKGKEEGDGGREGGTEGWR